MTLEHRCRQWLAEHRPTLDDLRNAEMQLALQADAATRAETTGNVESCLLEIVIAAESLQVAADCALHLPTPPHHQAAVFLAAAGQTLLDMAELMKDAAERRDVDEIERSSSELITGRNQLVRAMTLLGAGA